MKAMKRSVLYVDDDPFFQRIVTQFLKERHYLCHTAFSVSDAFDRLDYFVPDIIISDYEMPEICGLMFLRSLRCRNDFKKIPFVLYTDGDTLNIKHEITQLNAWVYNKRSPINDLGYLLETLYRSASSVPEFF